MRKIFTKTALLAFCLFLGFSAKAQTFTDGDYTFSILSGANKTVSVQKFNNTAFAGAVAIPASVSHDGNVYTVTELGAEAFSDCTGMTSVTIPDNVTSIGGTAFNGCKGLTSVKLPDNLTSISDYVFYGCSGLRSITIPDNVISIGDAVFLGCKGLTSITIPDNVTSIGNYTFQSCGLTSVTIHDKVTLIGEGAFWNCKGMISAKIGNGVTEIKNSMFKYCTALATVTIGNSVESIGAETFYDCNAIRTVYSRNVKAPTWAGSKFESAVYSNAALHVREGGAKASYNATPGWEFATITEDPKVGVDEVNSQVVNVFAQGGYINVTGVEDNTPIAIYTLQGSLIYSGMCASAPIEVSGAGLYIARIAGKSYKVVAL